MRVHLLGPVDVVVGGEPRAVQGLRRKAVLAVIGSAPSSASMTTRRRPPASLPPSSAPHSGLA